MSQFNQKNLFECLMVLKQCLRTQNCKKLHEWVMVGPSASWHLKSAEWHLATPWHLCYGGLNPQDFPTRVSRFRVFWKIFSSFMIMKHSPIHLQTLWNLFKTWLGTDIAYIDDLSYNKVFASRLKKHNNLKQKSSVANNQKFSNSTIYDINRWVHSFDFSTKVNFTAYKLKGIKALRNVKIKWNFLCATVKF